LRERKREKKEEDLPFSLTPSFGLIFFFSSSVMYCTCSVSQLLYQFRPRGGRGGGGVLYFAH
jgi:hypothetical protein